MIVKRKMVTALGLALACHVPLEAQEPMDLSGLVQRGHVYVHPQTLEPYSGSVVAMWTDEVVRERGTLVEGVWDGVHEWYHLNGRLSTRETYTGGILDGPSESYFKSGQLSAKETYGNGRLHGPYESYWHRGALAESGAWTDGEPCGNWLSFGRTVIYPPCPAFND